jgi:hypothetical protein
MPLKEDIVKKFSDPKIVFQKAKKYLGKDVEIGFSKNSEKKYYVINPEGKKVNFGQIGYADYTKHHNKERRNNYLTRSANIKGDWKDDKYSPNNLARNLLW